MIAETPALFGEAAEGEAGLEKQASARLSA